MTTKAFLTEDYEGDLLQRVQAYRLKVEESIGDGVSFADVATILFGGMRIAVVALDGLPIENSKRRELVLQVADKLFDIFAPLAVPLPLRPAWFLLAPSARKITQTFISGGIEFLLPLVREPKET